MPKIKTNRSAAKRFSRTGKGKIKFKHSYARHILTTKTRKRKRHLRKRGYLDSTAEKQISRLLPYL
ncbi:MAG: 50S ribosomal protein L35 [Deltaproteobacteria bacterium]|nr:MAG: 50S ribosomal protein L35 [Deltaproteobacteria bacterium]